MWDELFKIREIQQSVLGTFTPVAYYCIYVPFLLELKLADEEVP